VKKELPVTLFESELRVMDDKPVMLFAKGNEVKIGQLVELIPIV
jgi:hypothetical protein